MAEDKGVQDIVLLEYKGMRPGAIIRCIVSHHTDMVTPGEPGKLEKIVQDPFDQKVYFQFKSRSGTRVEWDASRFVPFEKYDGKANNKIANSERR